MHFVRLSGIVGVSIDSFIFFFLFKDFVVIVSVCRSITEPMPAAFVTHSF
jgi:hypothetical protein